MSRLITLSYFGASEKHYHIYTIHDGIQGDHHHDYFHMLYVEKGRAEHTHERNTMVLLPGEAFLVPPGFTHSCSFAEPGTSAWSLAFSPELFHSGFSQSNIYRFLSGLSRAAVTGDEVRLKVTLSESQQESLTRLMQCLLAEQARGENGDFSAAPSLIAASLYILAQAWGPLSNEKSDSAAEKCRKYIDAHYTEDLTIAALCKKFAVSRSLLCSSFRTHTGEPLKQYLLKKRIMAAETMIRRKPDMSLAEVSAAAGFSDPSSFYRNFIHIVGVSPSGYRHALKQ